MTLTRADHAASASTVRDVIDKPFNLWTVTHRIWTQSEHGDELAGQVGASPMLRALGSEALKVLVGVRKHIAVGARGRVLRQWRRSETRVEWLAMF